MNATPQNTAVVSNLCYRHAADIPNTTRLMHESARRMGMGVKVFEDEYPEKFDFAMLKVNLLQRHIANLPLDVKYILYVDSRDVLFLKPLAAICAMYNSFDTPLLFSAENKCAPHRDPAWAARFPKQPHGFNFHNGGVYMGERQMLNEAFDQLKLVRELVKHERIVSCAPFLDWNDQHLWQAASVEGMVKTTLDSKQELFCSFHMCEWSDFDWRACNERHPLVLKNGSCPAIVHFAGERGPTIEMFWHLLKTDQLSEL